MNILAPYSWIKEYLQTEFTPEDYARQVTLIGNEVEKSFRADVFMGSRVVVGKICEVHPHPNADKLRLVLTEVALGNKQQIVCGGSNLEAGQLVAVAMPDALVSWHGTEEVQLKETEIRGQASFGMICAAEEIGFAKLSSGDQIWDLSQVIPNAVVGTPLAQALDLAGETIFNIEQTTNRPDGMSIVGQAREAYAAMLGEFVDPFAKAPVMPLADAETQDVFSIRVDDQKLCPRYMGTVLEVRVGPSPWWMQRRLLLAGAKPINNVVDVTNYVRLEYGQPLHTFDYLKIAGGSIIVRKAEEGETIVALDGESYTLTPDMLVIADATKPVAIAGVMGGMGSGVTAKTTKIILEAATFDPLSIRSTWRALNLQSDSQILYEKGVSAELPAYGLARAVELLQQIAEGKVVTQVQDVRGQSSVPKTFILRPERVNALIGVALDVEVQTSMLTRLGFALSEAAGEVNAFSVRVPFWRDMDIESDVDLTEEIARLYGYANLPSTLPVGAIPRREPDTLLDREQEIKDLLAGAGWTEIYANSFIDPTDLVKAGFGLDAALAIENPLTEESVMRPTLLPTMLRTLAQNELHPTAERLFELQRVYLPREGDLPEERSMLIVSVMMDCAGEHLFRSIKGVLETLCDHYHVAYELKREEGGKQYHPGRSASVWVGNVRVGTIGEIHPLTHREFGIDRHVALLEIDVPALEPHLKLTPTYSEPSLFPSVYRDLAILVDEAVEYGDVQESMQSVSSLLQDVELFDLYRGTQVPIGKKSLAVHLEFSANKTLTSEEVDVEMKRLVETLTNQFNAIVRE
ncbi:TPA: phenylalanine--tRNA ligase subunit beta [Candidatus Uhrbacteria bacterium]|nr:phenylalanine--tRNA ligase subunit beta [Candidatus Uhrbacteria bacterium]